MKKIKLFTFLSLLVIIIVFFNSRTTKAETYNNLNVSSLSISSDYDDYAKEVYLQHLNVLIKTGDLKHSISNYYLGHPFTVFNVTNDNYNACYPIISNMDKKIEAILEINYDTSFSASMSISFSKELNQFVSDYSGNYAFISDGINLYAYNETQLIKIYSMFDNINFLDINTVKNSSFDYNNTSLLNYNDLLNKLNVTYQPQRYNLTGIDRPSSYKTINVKGVSQVDDTCWAATCAALINYYKNTNLSCLDVAKYVYGDNWDHGGSWTEIKKAYNHWNLYPKQTGPISFTQIKNNINNNKPMHLGLTKHSVGLIGYEYWNSSNKILILLEPNGGRHSSVSLNANGNFSYELGGKSRSWIYTRYF